ncbi:hypothetical protein [Aeromonas hydrophila]|uniref:hypothetical protein n=1 Tax=Aeromonas hydrophila TaxID=644 RepID=UPI003D2624DB
MYDLANLDIYDLVFAVAIGAVTSGCLTWCLMRRLRQKMEAELIERGVAALDEQGKVLMAVIDQRDRSGAELREKLYILTERIKKEAGWLPRAFCAEWDNKTHAMSGIFIANDEDGVAELIRQRETSSLRPEQTIKIKEVKEVDISEPCILQASGWNHNFR